MAPHQVEELERINSPFNLCMLGVFSMFFFFFFNFPALWGCKQIDVCLCDLIGFL
jgi:hypothetical protein